MNVIVALVAGVIIGWLIEWVIDWLFWRQDDTRLKDRLQTAEADLRQAQTQLSANAGRLQQLEATQQETVRLNAELSQARTSVEELESAQTACHAELDALKQKLQAAETERDHAQTLIADGQQTIADLRAKIEALMAAAPSSEEDMLERVKGIGAVFSGRLKAAGVKTFAQLAQLTPDRVQEIINPEEWQKIDPASWIAQAGELAAKKAAK